MTAITPPVTIPPPAAGPIRYGLFTAARGPLDLPPHAGLGGLQWEPDTCGVAHPYTAVCPPTTPVSKTMDLGTDLTVAAPYAVYASINCSPVGRPVEEFRRRATARLLTGEQHVVEQAVWDGAGVGATPNLTGATSTTVVTTLTGFAARVAALEQAFYDAYGYQGTIHVNTAAEGAAASSHMMERDGALRVTPLGSVWSIGAGYGITGPANAAPAAGSAWAFMTPPVTIWRSVDILVPDPAQTLNQSTNQMYAVAEREYVHGWDCDTVLAIEVPLETTA